MTTASAAGVATIEATEEAARATIEALLGTGVVELRRIGDGRNSRVYRVLCGNEVLAAKFYFGTTADGRGRLATELAALEFLWRHGWRSIPEPLLADESRQLAIYGFIAGQPICAAAASAEDIRQLVAFLAKLHDLSEHPEASAMPVAAEAFFTLPEILQNLEMRLARLTNPGPGGPAYEALSRFLTDQFLPALACFGDRAREIGVPELPHGQRTLSPSDYGFHNALRRDSGEIVFLDFEYFGWDDPAKLVSDIQLHPQMQLAPERSLQLMTGLREIFGAHRGWRHRVEALYPLFALKWCLILLNEFRPEQIARRQFVDGQDDAEACQLRHLEAAQQALRSLVAGDGQFPFPEALFGD
ncbi:MAG: hypothetical protein JOZ39_01225 [Chloroflexi bacterium]|nr:hypothetical protein [Chloroflexota bacterium]